MHGALLLALGTTTTRAFSAPPGSASQLTQQAQELMAQKHFAEASEKLAASKALHASAQTVLLLAQCYEQMGRVVLAVNEYKNAARASRAEGQKHRAAAADAGVARLTPRVAHVTIEGPVPAITDLEVRLDGERVDPQTLSVATPMDPGAHNLEASAPLRKTWSLALQVADGESPAIQIPQLESEEGSLGAAMARATQSKPEPTKRGASRTTTPKPEPDTSGFLPLPVLFYGPETDFGFGAFGLYYFHVGDPKRSRSSNVRSSLTGTTKGQVLFDIGPDLWLAKDIIHVELTFFAKYFPDAYYGIGNQTPFTAYETFTERSYIGSLNAQVRVLSQVYAGLRARVDERTIKDHEPGKLLDTEDIHGRFGGLAVGVGPAITYDSRDNTYAPARGAYLDFGFSYYPAQLGSDFRFGYARVDLRKYFPIGDSVLALQFVSDIASGETPFYLLPRIGGTNNLRGVFFGRYRDNLMLEAQGEYRFPIFWHFGGAAFLGAGKVAHAVDALDFGALRVAGGTGLRYAVVPSERINIRLDVAYAAEGINYYLDLNEAF